MRWNSCQSDRVAKNSAGAAHLEHENVVALELLDQPSVGVGGGVTDREGDIPVDALRIIEDGPPSLDRTPVVGDDPRLFDTEDIEQPDDIGDERLDAIRGNLGGHLRLTAAARIGSDHPVPRGNQGGDHVPPHLVCPGNHARAAGLGPHRQ
jgi:hypothetical protein